MKLVNKNAPTTTKATIPIIPEIVFVKYKTKATIATMILTIRSVPLIFLTIIMKLV
jgi:hypothetical protein